MGGTAVVDEVRVGRLGLAGTLAVPAGARGVVIFAHGSGSSRNSCRNVLVASRLRESGLGTLLFDLLTEGEAADRRNVFDIGLLARRVGEGVAFVREAGRAAGQAWGIGVFGASTGAGAAIVAAAADPGIGAVVSRGGRPDLAGPALARVHAPTLLIVGERDEGVIELNEQAFGALRCVKELEIVPGASHLFEEPGTLDAAAGLAREWFEKHLGAGGGGGR